MGDIASDFLHGEMTASTQILAAGVVVVAVAVILLVSGWRHRARSRGGFGAALAAFGALMLVGGLSYRGTVDGLLATVPAGFAEAPRATVEAELERMTTGTDRLDMLVQLVWPSLIVGGLIVALLLRHRARAVAGVALGIAVGSVLTGSVDLLGLDRSEPYEARLREYAARLDTPA